MIRQHEAIVNKRITSENAFGSEIVKWENFGKLIGVMDVLSITKGRKADKVIEDSTHIFICKTDAIIRQGDRLVVDNLEYEVNYADRPMMGNHLEIELKLTIQQGELDIESLVYFGISTEESMTRTDLMLLNSQQFDEKYLTKVLEATDGNLFIAYPKSFGKSSIRLNSKLVTNWNIDELNIDGVIYYVYKTSVVNSTLKIELF